MNVQEVSVSEGQIRDFKVKKLVLQFIARASQRQSNLPPLLRSQIQ